MNWLLQTLSVLMAAVIVSGCGSSGHSADPPTDLAVTAGDSRVTLTWTQESGVEYWAYYAPADSISVDNWTSITGSVALMKVSSPLVISSLTNGTTYSFTMDARVDGGPRGAGTASISTVPRLAGETWTAGTALGSIDLRSVTYGSEFVAVGLGGVIGSSTAGDAFSTTGITISDASTPDLYAVSYGGSTYVAGGAGGKLLYSTDAATWTVQTSPTSSILYGLATNGSNYYVGVGASGTVIYSSGGKSWTSGTSGVTTDLMAVGYGNSLYVAVGKGGVVLTSSNGSAWTIQTSNTTSDLLGVTYGTDSSTSTGRYVAVGASGTIITSTDGSTWTVETALSGNLNAVHYGSQFMLVGGNGIVYTSTTGQSDSWTARSSGSSSDLYAVTYGSGAYVTVGTSGTNLLSK